MTKVLALIRPNAARKSPPMWRLTSSRCHSLHVWLFQRDGSERSAARKRAPELALSPYPSDVRPARLMRRPVPKLARGRPDPSAAAHPPPPPPPPPPPRSPPPPHH